MAVALSQYIRREGGSSTVEFVAIFLALIAVIFFVIEATLYLFSAAVLEKAAQAGVRAAVVSTPLVAGLPDRNQKTSTGVFGIRCSHASAPCVGFATASCTSGTCEATGFNRIFDYMQGFAGQLEASNITITYSDVGLGFAGGPIVPLVTVSIQGVGFETGILGLLLTNAGVLATLPARSASMTGEDLG